MAIALRAEAISAYKVIGGHDNQPHFAPPIRNPKMRKMATSFPIRFIYTQTQYMSKNKGFPICIPRMDRFCRAVQPSATRRSLSRRTETQMAANYPFLEYPSITNSAPLLSPTVIGAVPIRRLRQSIPDLLHKALRHIYGNPAFR